MVSAAAILHKWMYFKIANDTWHSMDEPTWLCGRRSQLQHSLTISMPTFRTDGITEQAENSGKTGTALHLLHQSLWLHKSRALIRDLGEAWMPCQFFQAIRALYSDVRARVCIGGELSNPIEYNSVVKQGCKLAPYPVWDVCRRYALPCFQEHKSLYSIKVRFRYDGAISDLRYLKSKTKIYSPNTYEKRGMQTTLPFLPTRGEAFRMPFSPTRSN